MQGPRWYGPNPSYKIDRAVLLHHGPCECTPRALVPLRTGTKLRRWIGRAWISQWTYETFSFRCVLGGGIHWMKVRVSDLSHVISRVWDSLYGQDVEIYTTSPRRHTGTAPHRDLGTTGGSILRERERLSRYNKYFCSSYVLQRYQNFSECTAHDSTATLGTKFVPVDVDGSISLHVAPIDQTGRCASVDCLAAQLWRGRCSLQPKRVTGYCQWGRHIPGGDLAINIGVGLPRDAAGSGRPVEETLRERHCDAALPGDLASRVLTAHVGA